MKPSTRHLAHLGLAASLANLCLVRAIYGNLYIHHHGFFNHTPVNGFSLTGLALNLILLTLLFWLAATALHRLRLGWLNRVGALVVVTLFLIPLNFARLNYLNITGTVMIGLIHHPIAPLVMAVGAGLIWYWSGQAIRVVRAVLFILLPLSLWTWLTLLVALIKMALGSPVLEAPALAALRSDAAVKPRVILLVLDELDYRIAFEKRPDQVRLPELHRLRSEMLFASQAHPPGNSTLISMPSLTTGRRVLATEPCAAGDAVLTWAGADPPSKWSEQPTLFSQAHSRTVNCAAVTWYLPYDRLFGNHLVYCSWYPLPLFDQARGLTLREAMANQCWSMIAPLQQRRLHLNVYRKSLSDALQVVTNRSYDLSLIHLPGAHKPGIYLPDENRFSITQLPIVEGYFNNLILADHVVGSLRQQMESAGTWSNTWLLLTSDHWWRESDLYDGIKDLRVPFMLKAPGDQAGVEISEHFNTLLTKDLILAILDGHIRSTTEARDWIVQHRVDFIPNQ